MLTQQQFVTTHCLRALRSGAKTYKWWAYDPAKPYGQSAFGLLGGVRQRAGKIVARDDDWIGMKEAGNSFVLVPTNSVGPLYLGHIDIGAKVVFRFPQIRRFDGKRASGEDDPPQNGFRSIKLTGVKTLLPVHWAANKELGRLERKPSQHHYSHFAQTTQLIQCVEQLEGLTCGLRTGAGIMADAIVPGTLLEIKEDCGQETFTITMQAKLANFSEGLFQLSYDRGADAYAVHGCVGRRVADFDSLADTIARELCREDWNNVELDLVKRAPLRRAA